MLWLVLAASWFATLQLRPLLDPDEGRYAEIPREMLAGGDWVTPRLDGLKYFEKPPLQYWATAAAYSAFGTSEWTARLWTVGLAFLCLPMVYAWGRRLYGTAAGLGALAALAVSPYFVILGHLNVLDAGFAFWLAGAVFAFTLAQNAATGSQSERRWMIAAWAAAALAVLTKGIVVGVLAGLTLILYSLLERDFRPWRRLHLGVGAPVFLIITLPWFLLVSRRNPEFPEFFFIHEHFARFLSTVHQRVEPWWYFLPLLLLGVLPWVRFTYSIARRAWCDPGVSAQFRPRKFLLLFCAVTVVFFSLSGSKLAPYILPIMPALAALAGAEANARPQFMRDAGWWTAGLILCVVTGLCAYSALRTGTIVPEVIPWATVASATGVVAVILLIGGVGVMKPGPVVFFSVLSILGWQCLMGSYSVMPPLRTAKDLVREAINEFRPGTAVFSVGQYRPTGSFYLQRTLPVVGFRGELEFGMRQEPGRQSLTREQFLDRWRTSSDAVAFFSPAVYDDYRMRGLPGRVVASDGTTVLVSRNEFPDVPAADLEPQT